MKIKLIGKDFIGTSLVCKTHVSHRAWKCRQLTFDDEKQWGVGKVDDCVMKHHETSNGNLLKCLLLSQQRQFILCRKPARLEPSNRGWPRYRGPKGRGKLQIYSRRSRAQVGVMLLPATWEDAIPTTNFVASFRFSKRREQLTIDLHHWVFEQVLPILDQDIYYKNLLIDRHQRD